MIPPDQDAEFVANMEDVLETYVQAYDPKQPVVCMDEQLIDDNYLSPSCCLN